jgi:serine/threonine protein kinase
LLTRKQEGGKNEAELTFAIKKIHEWKEGDGYLKTDPFKTEEEILDQLKHTANPHIVQPLAVLPGARLFVFPWADGGDLRQWWKKTTPSSLEFPAAALSNWFLDQVLGLASAVNALHKIGFAPSNSTNIRHGDLKPENIVYFSGPDGSLGMLKIIDFGVSKIHHTTTFDRKLVPEQDVTNTTSSTHTYEAPEASVRFWKDCRSRRYDCWSLGCIFLEFVVWLLYDGKAALSVRDHDGRECKRYCRKVGLNASSAGIDKIEDVLEVHPSVCEATKTLLRDSRCCGADGKSWTAVGDVVRVIEDKLLRVRYEDRFEASRLCERLEEIREKAAGDYSDGYLTNWQETPGHIPEIFCPSPDPPVEPRNTWDVAG